MDLAGLVDQIIIGIVRTLYWDATSSVPMSTV